MQDGHGGELNYKMVVAPCETGHSGNLKTRWLRLPLQDKHNADLNMMVVAIAQCRTDMVADLNT